MGLVILESNYLTLLFSLNGSASTKVIMWRVPPPAGPWFRVPRQQLPVHDLGKVADCRCWDKCSTSRVRGQTWGWKFLPWKTSRPIIGSTMTVIQTKKGRRNICEFDLKLVQFWMTLLLHQFYTVAQIKGCPYCQSVNYIWKADTQLYKDINESLWI